MSARRWIRALAVAPFAIAVPMDLFMLGVGALHGVGSLAEDPAFAVGAITISLACTGAGALLSVRRPTNPIGWLLSAIGLFQAVIIFAEAFGLYALVVRDGTIEGGTIALWVAAWGWIPSVGLLVTFLLLLFPDGHLPSPRWRWIAWASAIAIALAVGGMALGAWRLRAFLLSADDVEPTGVAAILVDRGMELLLVSAVASMLSVVVRFRRASGDERQQLRWFLFAAAFVVVTLISSIASNAGLYLFGVAFLTIPAAITVAVLKYRLYDLDVVIRKTVVFAVVAGAMTLAALAVVLALPVGFLGTGLSGWERGLLLVGVGIGVLMGPLRRWARRVADRVVYGRRATPYEVLTEFSGRVGETYATEDVLPRMARILGEGAGAAGARVWLKVGGTLRPASAWPADAPSHDALDVSGDELPTVQGESAFEVRDRGELLGALSVTMPANDPMNPSKERLIRDLASQAGLVLRNVGLIEELRASRQRLVAAQDEERRRLERNLHDGAQQQLVALGVQVRLARQAVERDPPKAAEILDAIQGAANDALEDLRDLARGIYPPLLADQGLATALEAQARKVPLSVTVEPDGIGRYGQEVEAAVYFCALEALNNVTKYAAATRVDVRLVQDGDVLVFEVRDDGVGFDPSDVTGGTGLQGMADRLDAIGGALEITAAPGAGTTVRGRVPTDRRSS